MTNRAAAGPVLALTLSFAAISASAQKSTEPITAKLPAVSILGAESLSAKIDLARLLYENGQTILEYRIATTGTEPLLGAELTLFVYDQSAKRRETQKIVANLDGFLEAGSRKVSRAELSVRVDFTDRVSLGISRADTSTGPWTNDRFDERADKDQLPAVDVIDPGPMPVRLESARLVEKDDQMQVELELVSRATDPIARATLVLLVYDEDGKRTGLQDEDVPEATLPVPAGEKTALQFPIDSHISIKAGERVRLGVKSVSAGGPEQTNDHLVADSDAAVAAEHESHVIVVSPDVAPAGILNVRLNKDWEMRPRSVVLAIENRRDEPLLRASVNVTVSDSKLHEKPHSFSKSCSFDFTATKPPRAPIPPGGTMPFSCGWSTGQSDKLHKEWLMVISLTAAATANESWSAGPNQIKK